MTVKVQRYKLKVTFLTEVLGAQSTKQLVTEFVASKAGFELPDEELTTLPDHLERGTTVFHKDDDGNLLLWDYQLRGFLKNAGKVLNGKVDGKVRNLKSKVEDCVFVVPRNFILHFPKGEGVGFNERPLRADTARGPRVALARSEAAPAGTWFECEIHVIPSEITENVLRDLLDYGVYCGLGQWRSGGHGSISYTLEAISEK